MIHRLLGGPDLAQHAQILVGAGIAFVMAQVVAVAALVFVRAAGDVVHRHPALGVVVQRGQLTCRHGGLLQTRSVRQQQPDALGHRGRVAYGQQVVGTGGMRGHQDAVETGMLVGLGEHAHEVAVDHRAPAREGFGDFVRLDHADELDTHGGS